MLDLIRRIQNEEQLTPADEARLDALLESQRESMVALMACLKDSEPPQEWRASLETGLHVSLVPALVRGLEDDVPSLAWRSALNDRLLAVRPRRRRRWTLGWNLAAVAACAASIAAIWVYSARPIEPAAPPAHSIEAQLIAAHQDTARAVDLGVASLAPGSKEEEPPLLPRWSELDLEAL